MAVGEWDQRQLCPDGACIGVIGPDGTCRVCGRAAPNWGDERNRGLIAPEDDDPDAANLAAGVDEDEDEDDDDGDDGDEDGDEDDDDEDDDDDDDDDDEEPPEPDAAVAPRGEWSGRRLCPDGACIGVIGPEGRCRVCGRRESDAPAEPASEPTTPSFVPDIAAAAPTAAAAAPDEPAAPREPAPGPSRELLDELPAAPAATSTAGTDHEPCPTPGCGGQIGADGRCAACGKGAS